MYQLAEPLRTVQLLQSPHSPRPALWTPQELQTLKDHYPFGGTRTVAPMLPRRSKATIRFMAHKLSIQKGSKR